MARGRFLSKSLSTSECFAKLHDQVPALAEFCQVLYPLLIAHSDDYGRQQGDAFTVKLTVHPTSPRGLEDFRTALQALHDVTLINWYEVDGKRFIQIREFDQHQQGLHKRTAPRIPDVSGSLPVVPGNSRKAPEPPGDSGLREGKRREEKKDLSDKSGDVRSGAPTPPARLRDVAPVERARREHPLDEPPPTTALLPESLQQLDAFISRYPNKQASKKAVHDAWLALNPSSGLAARILADLDARCARGWPPKDTALRYVKNAANWLRERCWETPLPGQADASPTPRTLASMEGRTLTSECAGCGGEIKGAIRNGAPVYDDCAKCAKKAKAS